MKAVLVVLLQLFGSAQVPSGSRTPNYDAKHPPRFEDFPVAEKWTPPAVPIKLMTPSERMFRTSLTNASKEPPTFAGHFRVYILANRFSLWRWRCRRSRDRMRVSAATRC